MALPINNLNGNGLIKLIPSQEGWDHFIASKQLNCITYPKVPLKVVVRPWFPSSLMPDGLQNPRECEKYFCEPHSLIPSNYQKYIQVEKVEKEFYKNPNQLKDELTRKLSRQLLMLCNIFYVINSLTLPSSQTHRHDTHSHPYISTSNNLYYHTMIPLKVLRIWRFLLGSRDI